MQFQTKYTLKAKNFSTNMNISAGGPNISPRRKSDARISDSKTRIR